MSATFTIGTRKSELALRQARIVQDALAARGIVADLVTFDTTGDRRLDEPLAAIGAKGLFTAELEDALARGEIDCAVHSLKDLPTDGAYGTEIVAILEREDPRDVLVRSGGAPCASLAELPRGARVGTSSLRRRAQLRALRPDLEVVELRGNVPTRIRKVDEGQADAAILAAAGLLRLGLAGRIASWLDAPEWLPAPGQGAIAVQVASRRDDARAALQPLDHAPTRAAVRAERVFLATLEGGCQVPIGALVTGGAPGVLHGLVADVDGSRIARGSCAVQAGDPEVAGIHLANELLVAGGAEILHRLRALDEVVRPQPE